MSDRGTEWYKREPRAFLEGVRRLTEREIAIYAIVLDLIYDGGHQTLNDPKHIASYFSDLGVAAVRRTIACLCAAGKLEVDGEYLTNKRARNQGKTKRELSELRRDVGRSGGLSSGKSRAKPSQNRELTEARAQPNGRRMSSLEGEGDKKEAIASKARERAQIGRDFVAFWQIFPRREAKGNAEKAYAKAREAASADEIFAGAQHYALQRTGQDRRYTRLPASWLNGKGWLDEKPDNVVPLGRPRDLREIRDPVDRARYQSF